MLEYIMSECNPGLLAFMGSGETTPNGGLVFETVVKTLPPAPKIGILETPAGFELNSASVAKRVADYIDVRLQNYSPQIMVIPARRKGSEFSTDAPENTRSVMGCDMIFLGPGSPSYAVRQLAGSLVWDAVRFRFNQGAALVFASAACIAMGKLALPIYEIFKVGEDPHWKPGLDLLGDFGLPCVIVPHWNNAEGGKELDTSHCFIGKDRFVSLAAGLPEEITIIGIYEHTGLLINLQEQTCSVIGKDSVEIIKNESKQTFESGTKFPLSTVGVCRPINTVESIFKPEIISYIPALEPSHKQQSIPDEEVLELQKQRDVAREQKDWVAADNLRKQIELLGWQVTDTPNGSKIDRL